MKKTALVLGAGGFIGSHLVKRLKGEGFWVRGVDIKFPTFSKSEADNFILGDLRDQRLAGQVIQSPFQKSNEPDNSFDEVYQLAADMGGAGYIFTGEHDAEVIHNSSTINLNIAREASYFKVKRLFYSSSACVYPEHNQSDPLNPKCDEASAYPANPDSEYGWEKLFSERVYLSFYRNKGLPVRIGRYHNIFGPEGTYDGGREKAPAALCRKVASAKNGESIDVWGSGEQTRSFLYIDECIEATLRLTRSDFVGPVNIGSEEMLSMNDFAKKIIDISQKELYIKNIPGPTGVNGRTSDNRLILDKLGWQPSLPLSVGLENTYRWIDSQINDKT
jgi:nucleoside-diphosphate-sugar epimerase